MKDNYQLTHCYLCGKKVNFDIVYKDNFMASMSEKLPLPYPFERSYDYIVNADGSNPHWLCSDCKRKIKGY